MDTAYLTNYERMLLTGTVEEIQQAFPNVLRQQIENDMAEIKAQDTEWERAKLRRFLRKIKHLIWSDK